MNRFKSIAIVGVLALLFAGNTSAAIINGSFETGLNGWTTIGNVTQSGAWSTDGDFSALLIASTSITEIETGLGISSGTLDAITDNGINGSTAPTDGAAIYQDISVDAGEIITFDFNFVNNESNVGWNDTAVALFENGLLSAYFLGSSIATNSNSASGSFSATLSGTAQLSFITFNQGDTAVDPYLYIDNVSTNVSAVPVPAAVWLFGSGLIGLVGIARRKNT